jgi:hypothetical protein
MKYHSSPNEISFFYFVTEENSTAVNGVSFFKIGTCTQQLYDRLRVLNQGNPRKLVMSKLYAGSPDSVKYVESWFKNTFKDFSLGGPGRTEWYQMSIDDAEKAVNDYLVHFNHKSYRPLYAIKNSKIVPYTAGSPLECPFSYVSRSYVFLEARDEAKSQKKELIAIAA